MKKLLVVFVLICGQLGYAYGQNDNDDSKLVIIHPIYDNITNYAGALVVEKNHKKRIMNQSGKSIISVEYTDDDYLVRGYINRAYWIVRNEKVKVRNILGESYMKYSLGVISNDGKTIIPFGKCQDVDYVDKIGLYIMEVIDSEREFESYDNNGKKISEYIDGYVTHEEICDITGKTLYRQGVDYDDYYDGGFGYSGPFLLFRNGDEWIYELKDKKIVPWAKFKFKWNSDYCKKPERSDVFLFFSYGSIDNTITSLVYTYDGNLIHEKTTAFKNGEEVDGKYISGRLSTLPYICIYNHYNGKSVYNHNLKKTIVPLGKYDDCDALGDVILVRKNLKKGLVDRYGKEIVPLGKYDEISVGSFYKFGGIVEKEKKYGLINEKGEEIVPLGTYDDINNIDYSDLKEVEKDNKYGLINNNGQVVLPLEYDEIGKNYPKFIQYGGISIIRKNDKVGAVDANGKIVIPVKYDNYESYFWDYIAFKLDGKTEIYDYKGNLMLPLGQYEDYENRFGKLDYLKFYEEWTWSDENVNHKSGLFIFYKNGKKGVVKLW